MMKKSIQQFYGILLCGLIAFVPNNGYAQHHSGSKHKSGEIHQNIKAKHFIDKMQNDTSVFFGFGTYVIGNDYSKAMKKAKEQALGNLTEKIKVRVISDIKQNVMRTAEKNTNKFSEVIQENLKENTNTYTDQILQGVNDRTFENYPDSGSITVAAWLKKSDYRKGVNDALRTKKTAVRTAIDNGNNEFSKQHYLQAVSDWIQAKNTMHMLFNKIPLQDNLGKNGKFVDVGSWIDGKIASFFNGISFQNINENINYDAKGHLNKPITVAAKYKDEMGEEHPVINLPLKVNFADGKEGIVPGLTTGNYGVAKFNVPGINTQNKTTSIYITVDSSRISDLSAYQVVLPSIKIQIKKLLTLAFAVTFRNDGQYLIPTDVKNKVQSTILNQGLAVEQVSVRSSAISGDILQRIEQLHPDYFLFVFVDSNGASTVGGYKNIYMSTCSATISLFELPQGNMVGVKQISGAQGFGTTESGAEWDSFSKIASKIMDGTEEMIGEIK